MGICGSKNTSVSSAEDYPSTNALMSACIRNNTNDLKTALIGGVRLTGYYEGAPLYFAAILACLPDSDRNRCQTNVKMILKTLKEKDDLKSKKFDMYLHVGSSSATMPRQQIQNIYALTIGFFGEFLIRYKPYSVYTKIGNYSNSSLSDILFTVKGMSLESMKKVTHTETFSNRWNESYAEQMVSHIRANANSVIKLLKDHNKQFPDFVPPPPVAPGAVAVIPPPPDMYNYPSAPPYDGYKGAVATAPPPYTYSNPPPYTATV